MKNRSARRRRGLTLIEVLLVLVILLIIGTIGGVAVRQQQKRALTNAAQANIHAFTQSLKLYEMDIRSYPSNSQGLQALIAPPSDLPNPDRWQKGYYDKTEIPLDPWDNAYKYELIDADTFRITSAGPDGQFGSDDDIMN